MLTALVPRDHYDAPIFQTREMLDGVRRLWRGCRENHRPSLADLLRTRLWKSLRRRDHPALEKAWTCVCSDFFHGKRLATTLRVFLSQCPVVRAFRMMSSSVRPEGGRGRAVIAIVATGALCFFVVCQLRRGVDTEESCHHHRQRHQRV